MENEETRNDKKERLLSQLKKAREHGGSAAKEILERRKAYDDAHKAIIKAVEEEARTVPQIAEVTGLESSLVFWHINALRKYNVLQEEKRRGDYLFYRKK
jgi:hypothetical protein